MKSIDIYFYGLCFVFLVSGFYYSGLFGFLTLNFFLLLSLETLIFLLSYLMGAGKDE